MKANPSRIKKDTNLELFKKAKGKKRVSLGGGTLKSHAKRARPLAPRSTYHIVLKSSKARQGLSFLRDKNKHEVRRIIDQQAKKYFVTIESYANVGNHLHLKVYSQACDEFRNFLRSVTCMIARKVTGARRGKRFGKFWDGLVFTRMLRKWTEHIILKRYIFANRLEAQFNKATRDEYLAIWYGSARASPVA